MFCDTDLFEVGAGGENFVDEILDRENVEFAKGFLNNLVIGERNALLVDLAVTTLVNKLTDGLQVGLAREP